MAQSKHTHTPGPWMAASAPSSVVGWPVVGPMGRSICNVSWMPRKVYPDISDADYAAFNAECEANASLIAEAGTVAHETGLTPRQLAEQRAELLASESANLAVIENLLTYLSKHEERLPPFSTSSLELRIEKTRAAIAKAEGGAA